MQAKPPHSAEGISFQQPFVMYTVKCPSMVSHITFHWQKLLIAPPNLLRLNSSKIHWAQTFWDSVVWVTSAIISLLLCSPHSFLPLGLHWAFCSGHSTSWSLTFENARRGTLKVYLGFSFNWIWHLWPIIINISKWIVSKEIIHTNNNFVKMWNFARLRKICSTWQ